MDSRLIKPKALPQPLLKDYLLDDMSSCSSNGFKSFPRRQCCASTVRILIEIDLKNKQQQKQKRKQKEHNLNFNKSPPVHSKNPSKCALVAFQSVITAVKRLPFGGGSSPEKKKPRNAILPRSLSMKILKKTSFWKRKSNHEEIERWKSFDQLMKDGSQPLDLSNSSTTSDFTVSDESSSGNSSSEVNSNLQEMQNHAVQELENGGVSTESTTSSGSSASTNSSSKNEEKEQFSPVSVLDCPFNDDDDEEEAEVSSPYQHRLARLEGTKKKLMKKIQRFECLGELEPVNLAKRFITLPNSGNESTSSLMPQYSASSDDKLISAIEEQENDKENEVEHKALNLLQQMEDTMPSYGLKIKADKLLLDFFIEKVVAQNVHCEYRGGYSFDEEVLDEAENWIHERKPRELFLELEVAKNREAYIKDMEKVGKWKLLNQEDYEEMARELENEIFYALLNELLLDISS